MDHFQQLIISARAKRNQTILGAREEYNHEVRAIRALQRSMEGRGPRRPHYRRKALAADAAFAGMTMTAVAATVLTDTGPLKQVNLVLAIQERGYRADDSPQLLLEGLRRTLRRHPERFRKDQTKRWSVVE